MFLQNVYEKGLAQASYVIGCQATGEAIVIDPKRDIDTYIKIAEQEKLRITHVTETHIHADFLSGSRELAAATGAQILLSDEGGSDWMYTYEHVGLKDNDEFKVGNLKFKVMHSPGHTPEHISFILTDTKASAEPIMIFTGDFVFVGDVGRPDLLEKAAGIMGTAVKGAKQMFESLKRFKQLPDHIQVWPGHGAGSACGKALGAVPSSTVGYEKLVNWALKIEDEEQFITELLAGQPESPKYFAMMKKLNKVGPQVLGGVPLPARLPIGKFKQLVDEKTTLIDTRNKIAFAGGHIPGSINIQDNNSFSTWAGWVLDYDKPFLLVADENRVGDLSRALIRIGLDNAIGYVTEVESWVHTYGELKTMPQLTVDKLEQQIKMGVVEVIDVRAYAEYNAGHIEGARNIHVGFLLNHLNELPHEKKIVLHCQGGDRSSIATSLLMAQGLTNVTNLTGGYLAWVREGYSVVTETAEPVL